VRRLLFLFAALLFGAAAVASAQARPRIGVRLKQEGAGPPNLIFSVTNLLEDPDWIEALNSAYRIQLHWRVSLSRSRLVADQAGRPSEWDDFVQKIPTIDLFKFSEPFHGKYLTTSSNSIDSLKALLGAEQRILTPQTLAPGRWYYTVQLDVSVDDQSDAAGSAPLLNSLQRLILGGPAHTYGPQNTASFEVRRRP
jgi:hypothetical protein